MSARNAATFSSNATSGNPIAFWAGTPEVYFSKPIDNSRLVQVEDPRRGREMKQFGMALGCLFLLVMSYAFQHFKAIEYGYNIETLKAQRDGYVEMNRALRLEEATLRNPDRIEKIARQFGLQPLEAGQVLHMDTGDAEGSSPVMAAITPISVVSGR